jgi:hypothetical protein
MQSFIVTNVKAWLGLTSDTRMVRRLKAATEAVAAEPLIFPIRPRPVRRWTDRSYPENVRPLMQQS